MDKREKVIKGLECCKIPFTKCYNGGCPYFENDGCKARLKGDALALLKAQKPRVMTPEEVFVWAEMPAEKRDPIFFEQRKGPNGYIANSACPKDYFLYCEDGDARCWTSRPTDEQRAAVSWEAVTP